MIPRNEHPNPGFYRENYQILNGEWDFDFDFGIDTDTEESNVNIDDFFVDAEQKPKEPKKIQCPHCGEWFEV